eukprot:scaffold678660_cov60-Prasinocladus_malaysianus.AAC.1
MSAAVRAALKPGAWVAAPEAPPPHAAWHQRDAHPVYWRPAGASSDPLGIYITFENDNTADSDRAMRRTLSPKLAQQIFQFTADTRVSDCLAPNVPNSVSLHGCVAGVELLSASLASPGQPRTTVVSMHGVDVRLVVMLSDCLTGTK